MRCLGIGAVCLDLWPQRALHVHGVGVASLGMRGDGELHARGLRRRKKLFGEADVAERMAAAGEFGAPLQNIINAYV